MPEETETVTGNPAQEQNTDDQKESSEATRSDEQNSQPVAVQVSAENSSQPSVEACILKPNFISETRSEPSPSEPEATSPISFQSQTQVWSVKTSLTPKSPEVIATENFLLHEQKSTEPEIEIELPKSENQQIPQKTEIPTAPAEVPEPIQVSEPEVVPQSVEPRTPANSETSEGGAPSGGEEPHDVTPALVLEEPRPSEPILVAAVEEYTTINGDVIEETPKESAKVEIIHEPAPQLTNGQSHQTNGECKFEPRKVPEPELQEPHPTERNQVLIEAIANELRVEDYKLPDVIEVKKHFEYVQPAHNDVSTAPPKKGALSTRLDAPSVRQAYEDVRYDGSETQWAVFKFEGPTIVTSATGSDFSEFKTHFGEDDRAFGYIRVQTGDEMSKRAKFLFVTWVGPSVSVLKRAKMSTDKALMKDILSNFAVELQTENISDINLQNFETELDKAAGAHYGTGVRG